MLETETRERHALDLGFDMPVDEREVIRVHSKSFALASKLLPSKVRDDVCKLYAWCRWCDDAVDEAPSREIAKQRLRMLRRDIDAIYDGRPPKLRASMWFEDLANRYDLPKQLPLDLLRGMESDLHFELMETQADLEVYCYRVAGVVGLMMCRLLGVTNPTAYENANRLGIAMQMTNIARDVGEDWDRERYYLPQSWLQLDPQENPRPDDHALKPLVERLLGLAEENYMAGFNGYASLPPTVRLAIRVAAAIYRDIGTTISKSNFSVMDQRHFVSFGRKLSLVSQQVFAEISDRFRARLQPHSFPISSTSQNSIYSASLLWSNTMSSQFHFLAVFGLSMTLNMATVLFALVGINPKLETYQTAPWIYSACSAIAAAGLWFWAQAIGKRLDKAAIRNEQ